MEDPLLEESLRQHLDLWINTEFEWTEDSPSTMNVGKDETALVTPGSGHKGKEDDKEMDLLDHLKSRVKGGRERNVLLMSDEKMGGDKSVEVDDRVGSKDVGAARVTSTTMTSETPGATTDTSNEQETAPAPTTTTTSATPDLASFLNRYSALLSSSLPTLDGGPLDDPSSGPLGQSQPRVNQDEVNKNVGSDAMAIKDGRDRSQHHQEFTVSHSQSQSQSHSQQQSIRHVPSSEYQTQSKQHDQQQKQQQQQQQTHDAPTPRHLVPPPAPINTPVVSRAQLNKSNGVDKQQQQQQQQNPATTQAQNLMALLTAAFPQYASFEPPMHQNQLGAGYGGGMTTASNNANNHHARANSDGASSTAAFGYHPAAFNGMDFNHHMSGEIDRVFGGAAGIAAAGVEFDGLYKSATAAGMDHGNALQLGPAGGRASSGSASGSLVEASLNSGEYLSAQQHQQFQQQQQHLAEGGYKKRKLSEGSVADAFESRFGRSPYPMINASAGNGRKRSSESMEADLHEGPLPDGVTAEEE
jgi:hypothetical protein